MELLCVKYAVLKWNLEVVARDAQWILEAIDAGHALLKLASDIDRMLKTLIVH